MLHCMIGMQSGKLSAYCLRLCHIFEWISENFPQDYVMLPQTENVQRERKGERGEGGAQLARKKVLGLLGKSIVG